MRRGSIATSIPARCNSAASQYRKGLALHSRTRIGLSLARPVQPFPAVAGIDDAVRPGGKVRLVVRGDDKVLLRRRRLPAATRRSRSIST